VASHLHLVTLSIAEILSSQCGRTNFVRARMVSTSTSCVSSPCMPSFAAPCVSCSFSSRMAPEACARQNL